MDDCSRMTMDRPSYPCNAGTEHVGFGGINIAGKTPEKKKIQKLMLITSTLPIYVVMWGCPEGS